MDVPIAVQAGQAPARAVAWRLIDVASGQIVDGASPAVIDAASLPGSIVNLPTLIAALENGAITPATHISCPGFAEVDGRRIACLHPQDPPAAQCRRSARVLMQPLLLGSGDAPVSRSSERGPCVARPAADSAGNAPWTSRNWSRFPHLSRPRHFSARWSASWPSRTRWPCARRRAAS